MTGPVPLARAPLPYGLLCAGRWPEPAVEISWTDDPARDAAWAAQVESTWQELKREEPTLHDATLAGLRGYLPVLDRLALTFARTTYRATAATHRRFALTVARFGAAGLGMGTACAVGLRIEGKLVFGRRSQRVFGGRGQWHPPAGHWEPDLHRDAQGRASPFACARTEMHEELGLDAHELEDLTLIGLQLNPETLKPELHFTARVPLTYAAFVERQRGARDAHEIDALLHLDLAQVERFLSGALGPPTDIARASAYLHDTLGLFSV